MNAKNRVLLQHFLGTSFFFACVWLFLLIITIGLGDAEFTIKGAVLSFIAIQVPAAYLTLRFAFQLNKNPID